MQRCIPNPGTNSLLRLWDLSKRFLSFKKVGLETNEQKLEEEKDTGSERHYCRRFQRRHCSISIYMTENIHPKNGLRPLDIRRYPQGLFTFTSGNAKIADLVSFAPAREVKKTPVQNWILSTTYQLVYSNTFDAASCNSCFWSKIDVSKLWGV